MDAARILEPLNTAQREAVTAGNQAVLVLAGAGSGKTRVLVHRAAWLVSAHGASPWNLFAVTFTNKAANEMRTRIEALLQTPTRRLWIGTFHGLAHRLLRRHWHEAGLREDFQILDSADQQRLIKRVMKDERVDERLIPPQTLQYFISGAKEAGLRPEQAPASATTYGEEKRQLYTLYQQRCESYGLVDFGELLLRSAELMQDHPALLDRYRERFRWLLVDEFQDTNGVQYDWLRQLCGTTGTPFAVGDDDQSIYRWRGAQVENIRRYTRDFTDVRIVRLERNYRSTGTILKAANAVIAHNASRFSKKLWTRGGEGRPVRLFAAYNEWDEAQQVASRARQHGGRLNELAVLYRSNAQSRVFEEALVGAGLPYRVYGGLRFFERAEIKDALAYLRLVANRGDDPSFERVVNNPPRRIGGATLNNVRTYARRHGLTLWEAAEKSETFLDARAAGALQGFTALIESLAGDVAGLELQAQVSRVVRGSGLVERLAASGSEADRIRVENLDELVNAAQMIEEAMEDQPESPLNAFLAHAALESGDDQSGADEDAVQLMTMHAAKGLEFPVVFLTGMEEGLFPHSRSMQSEEELEEERRLCYVGITRAMKELNLSYAEVRRLRGQERRNRPSRFLAEIPAELLEEVRPAPSVSLPVRMGGSADADVQTDSGPGPGLGQRVSHPKFGEGVVLNREGSGEHARVQVNFERHGSKWLVVAYARLELI
ncbi:DNA helicase II [Candidatus Foliamicus sp.]